MEEGWKRKQTRVEAIYLVPERFLFINEAIYSALTFVVTTVLNSDTRKNEFTNLLYDHLVLIYTYIGHSPGSSTELGHLKVLKSHFHTCTEQNFQQLYSDTKTLTFIDNFSI